MSSYHLLPNIDNGTINHDISKTQSSLKDNTESNNHQQSKVKNGKFLQIRVHFLDDSITLFQTPLKSLGKKLFLQICHMLKLIEIDYFGLEYFDKNNSAYWLDLTKPINRQISLNLQNPVMYFCVKFYPPDPNTLEDELTRYLFCLQIKRDLANGLLQCDENTAALIASYILQSALGNYDLQDNINYLSNYKFIPLQNTSFLDKVAENHKKHINLTPAESDLNAILVAKNCEFYGIRLNSVLDHNGVVFNLSVSHSGIIVFLNNTKQTTIAWSRIRKLSFKRKKFVIKLNESDHSNDTVEYSFTSRNECKNFWKKCIEQHTFFRCSEVKNSPKTRKKIFSRGSSFRYTGRTQQQVTEFVRSHSFKRSSVSRSNSSKVSIIKADNNSSESAYLPRKDNLDLLNSTEEKCSLYKDVSDKLGKCTEDNEKKYSLNEVHSKTNTKFENKNESLNSNKLQRNGIKPKVQCQAITYIPLNDIKANERDLNDKKDQLFTMESNSEINEEKSQKNKAEINDKPKIINKQEIKTKTAIKCFNSAGKIVHKEEKMRNTSRSITQTSGHKRRAISTPRSKCDMNHFYDHGLLKSNRTFFAQIKPITDGKSKNYRQMHCISVHSLPSLESYSCHDDTLDDPFDELINSKLAKLKNINHVKENVSISADHLNRDFKCKIVCKVDDDRSLESLMKKCDQEVESEFGSVDISNEVSANKLAISQAIIEFYLNEHFPDDLDKEHSYVIPQIEQSHSPTQVSVLQSLIIEMNVQVFHCY